VRRVDRGTVVTDVLWVFHFDRSPDDIEGKLEVCGDKRFPLTTRIPISHTETVGVSDFSVSLEQEIKSTTT
jgi:hypothetical protein